MSSQYKKRTCFPIQRSQSLIIWLFIAIFIGQMGCAHKPYTLPSPPSEKIRAQLGTIGVVSARFIPKAEFWIPAKGGVAGAGRGAATGAEKGLIFTEAIVPSDCGLGGLICLAFIVAGVVVGTVVGSMGGAEMAPAAASVEEAEAALKEALAALKIQDSMRNHILQVAQDQTHHHFVLLAKQGPFTIEEEANYRLLINQDIDTMLEISVLKLDLIGKWNVNPPLALVMTVRTRLIRIGDSTVLYDSKLEYKSGTRTFNEWAVNNAQPFLEELDRAYQSLAEKIIDELFLLYPLKLKADGS